MIKRIYLCEDNVTGLFSALYDAWREGRTQENAGIALKGFVAVSYTHLTLPTKLEV